MTTIQIWRLIVGGLLTASPAIHAEACFSLRCTADTDGAGTIIATAGLAHRSHQVAAAALPFAAAFDAWKPPVDVEPAGWMAGTAAALTADRRKVDEPGTEIELAGDATLACPGFYVLQVQDGPGLGVAAGSFGAELNIQGSGIRLLQGGLNFGGTASAQAPGYAAFSIANPDAERQRVSVALSAVSTDAAASRITLRIRLTERSSADSNVLAEHEVTLGREETFTFSADVEPGFFVLSVTPTTASYASYGVAALTSYLDRPGGGFQSGAVVGGYHGIREVSGFVGFCIAEPRSLSIRTEARPTRGAGGAGDLQVALRDIEGRVFFRTPDGPAELSAADAASLTAHLDTIAADPGWPQASVNAANALLADPRYTANAWRRFFADYFAARPLTDPLRNYIVYPTFHWFDAGVHARVQAGMYPALLKLKLEAGWARAIERGGDAFSAQPELIADLRNAIWMLIEMGRRTDLALADRQRIFATAASLYDRYPDILGHQHGFDRSGQPYFGALRTQLDMVLLAAAPSADDSRLALSTAKKQEIAAILGLQGRRIDLWETHSLLFLDNGLSGADQMDVVMRVLDLIPGEMHNTASITVYDYLGNAPPWQPESIWIHRPYLGVNIFGIDLGHTGNAFPEDVAPGIADVFSSVLVHEINHVVDGYHVQRDPRLEARRMELIEAAGSDPLNYLRSMFEPGFFVQAPQEFIASIANEWFTDSAKTFELGRVRFDAGRSQPLNQALFFAEIYSLGLDSTRFYRNDARGNLVRETIPVGRDGQGRINALQHGGHWYRYQLDAGGNVVGYTVE